MKTLSAQDWQWAANELGCEVAAMKAVALVESGGRSGFQRDGQPKILFEGHWFHKLTKGRFTTPENADVSHRRWVRKFYRMNQHKRLAKAVKLDRNAALQSASWGVFQVLGVNWRVCGYLSVQEFINDMYASERGHLNAFVGFIKTRGLADELQRKDWAAFAYTYNGPGYSKNSYDTKLANAYRRYKADEKPT